MYEMDRNTAVPQVTRGHYTRWVQRILFEFVLLFILCSVVYDMTIVLDYSGDMSPQLRRSLNDDDNLKGFKDNWESMKKEDQPIFWHIPKAGGSYIKTYLGSCYGKVLASEVGAQIGNSTERKLKVVSKGENKFVNVDTTTKEGIKRAKEMEFAGNDLVDVTISPLLYDVEELFSQEKSGRVFTILRDPIDRAISMFDYLRYAEWEPTYFDGLSNMTLEEYAKSDEVEDNFITRTLINKKKGVLSEDDMKKASEILNKKILVGLLSKIPESLDRFEKFFDWHFHDATVQEECRKSLITMGGNANKKKTEKPEEGSSVYKLLEEKNKYDVRLYAYAEKLFDEQNDFVEDKPDNFRLLKGNGI